MSNEKVQVCVFPIPGTAVIPFQTIELHIFEPRYRKMVQHCLEQDALMGVALGVKPISTDKDPAVDYSAKEALNRNHRSFRSAQVFSAGKIRLLEEFDDGRMLIQSTATLRVHAKSIHQEVPFVIADCETMPVEGLDDERWLQLTDKMQGLLGEHFSTLDRELLSRSESRDIKFFHLLSRFQWPADEIQKFLEIESLDKMADTLLKTLNGVELVSSPEAPSH